jgi:LysM repeat protein
MAWLNTMFGATNTTVGATTAVINATQVNAFRALLNQQGTIRMFCGTGGSFGNQAATVNLLRRLTTPHAADNLTYGFAGTIDVHYEGGAVTLAKLYSLMPELGGLPNGQINNATVNLIVYDPAHPPAHGVTFGFTGAVDSSTTDFATQLTCEYFLQLQPYNYNYAEKIWFYDHRPPVDLRAVAALNDPSFARRVSYVPPSTYVPPNWAGPYPNQYRVDIMQYLTTTAIPNGVRLVVSYAIMPELENVINSSPQAAAAVLCGGLLAWQNHGSYKKAAPVVVVNLNRFGDPTTPHNPAPMNGVHSLLEGNPTRNEVTYLNTTNPMFAEQAQKSRQVYKARSAYMKALDAHTRFGSLYYPQTVVAVQNAVQALTANQVLFIQLGPIPQPIFYYGLFSTNMVSLLEGANSTMAAINMGRPFLALPRSIAGVSPGLYPNTNRGFFSAAPPIDELAAAANQLNFDLDTWPTGLIGTNPCDELAKFLRRLTDEDSPTDPIHGYFQDIKTYYARSDTDKVNNAFAYLMYEHGNDHPQALVAGESRAVLAARAAALADDTNPLNALYAELEAEVVIGERLDLIPGVVAGGHIEQVILDVLRGYSATLWLTVREFTHDGEPGDIQSITLRGTTGVLQDLGIANAISVVFDAPDNQLRTQLELASLGSWEMPGVPWIQMTQPYLQITVSDGQVPVVSGLGGTYDPLGARLEVLIPVADGQWLTTAKFDKPYPSIDRAFQLAASVNLVQVLPPPLNTLVDLGLAQVDLYYRAASKDVPGVGFIMRSNSDAPLPLVGKVNLSDIEAQVAIVNPKTALAVKASANGSFTIGDGPDAGVVVVGVQYPEFLFTGKLASGEIVLADLLTLLLPGVVLELDGLPKINNFDFSYAYAADNLSVSMGFVFEPAWTFDFFGKPLFTLDNVGFAIARAKGLNTGSITATTTLFPDLQSKLVVAIGALYLAAGTWRFTIEQQVGTTFSINELLGQYLGADWISALPFPDVTGLKLQLDWGTKQATSFEFSAATATTWTPIPVLPDVTVTGKLKLGYRGKAPPALEAGELALVPFVDPPKAGAYGEIGAELTLWNIQLGISYNFDPDVKKLQLRWLALTATIEQNAQNQTVATFSLDGQSVGSLVETFVSWATGAAYGLAAPWNVLNSITLNGVRLIYNFTLQQVSFSIGIGPIDFGLFKLKGISLKYAPTDGQRQVEITIDGAFVWQSGDKVSWDPTKPETTPAPPGSGNKYLDLRLAALGQHVTVAGLTEQRRVQDVIAMLRKLKVPNPPEIPVGGDGQPVFAPANSWFVAFDFGVLKAEEAPPETLAAGSSAALVLADPPPPRPPVYLLQLSTVFNDPTLYALRIALDGPMAKIFAGLDFQIMYRQVSDTVGCYSARIALPNLMRKFQIGVASITLPDFGIDVYTNGDFQVDIGFPWNQDFSRSFTIELIIPPGIPVLGSAGFYFGKLSSATSDKVPAPTTGWFNPVLVFGFGGQIGLGKSIEAGILRAGFSLTVFGIIEGVLARWLPYNQPTSGANRGELQDGYYFSLTGTMGVQGRLYGSVDFAIIKADVDVAVKIFIKITFAAYEDIPILARAQVDVSASVTINLGLFKIKIGFSFTAAIEATFVLTNPMHGPPPWGRQLAAATHAHCRALAGRRRGRASDEIHARRMQRARSSGGERRLRATRAAASYDWSHLQPGTTLELDGFTAPVLTVAGDRAASAIEQDVCYVASFFLTTPAPLHADSAELAAHPAAATPQAQLAHAALARAHRARTAAATGAAATFEDLAVRIVQWAIAAGQPGTYTPDQVDALVVSDAFLDGLMQYLSGAITPTPIPATAIEQFLTDQTAICFAQTAAAGSADAVFFPAPPGTRLQVANYGTWNGFDYTFGGYNSTAPGYLEALNAYFKQLQVQIGAEGSSPAARRAAAPAGGPSIASYVFSDYFTSIASQAVQALRDGLANFKYVIDDTLGLQALADTINRTGELSGDAAVTPAQLAVANQDHPLSTAASGPLTIADMAWTTPGGLSFDAIAAQPIFGGGFTGKAIAEANAGDARLIAASQPVTLDGVMHRTQTGDSLDTIAAGFGVSVGDLLDRSDALGSATLIAPLAIVVAPRFGYAIAAGDTLKGVAARFAIGLDGLAEASAGVTRLFDRAADPNLNVPQLVQYQVGALIDEARRVLALQNLGAMTSRYYLHGLRLPTAGLTANARGLFVDGKPGEYTYPPELGLFGLTGQAFPLPAISAPVKTSARAADPVFQYTLTRGGDEGWLSLGSRGSAAVTFQLTDALDYQRYARVVAAAHAGPLAMQTTAIAASPVAELQGARFPLSTELPWQTPVATVLPYQAATPATPEPRLWSLPSALINTPNAAGALPSFAPVVARTDQATSLTVDEAVRNFGFGSLIQLAVRKTAPVAAAPTSERLYEIIGAPDRDIVLLERILDQLVGQDGRFQQVQLMYRPATTGSDAKGWQMDDPAATLFGISQVNLSTETRPPPAARAMTAAPLPGNLINTPLEALRLIWEASITRQGGFYLSYTTGIGGDAVHGLPDHAFNDRGEAELAVLCLFTADAAEHQGVADYMNVAATNEPLDLSDAALVARAVIVDGVTAAIGAQATLRVLAAQYYTGVDQLAARNATAPLAAGATLRVTGGVYEVASASPGGSLAAIATYFLTTVAQLKQANPQRTSWPDPLPRFTGLALPAVDVEIGKQYDNGNGGISFAKLDALAAYFATPLAELAAANADRAGVFPAGATLAVDLGPADLTAITPPGVIGIELDRTAPPAVPDDPSVADWGTIYLRNVFNLLGYRVADTPDFARSNWGLAGGPADLDAPVAHDKIRAPRAPQAGASWRYSRTLPYAALSKSGTAPAALPAGTVSPYAGVGGVLQPELVWLDLFGNRIVSELDAPGAGAVLNFPPQRVGYTDRLIGLGQWPGVANAFRIAPAVAGVDGAPTIVLNLAFDQSAYVDAPADKIAQAIAVYTQVLQQLGDPNGVTLALSTSVMPGVASVLSPAQGQAIVAWVTAIYEWLVGLSPVARAAGALDPTLELIAPLDAGQVNAAQIFMVTAAFTIARDPRLVNGALDGVAGVARAVSQLAPATGSLTGDDGELRDLTVFGAELTRALAAPGVSYRVAAGSTRNAFTSGDARDVWAVQLGTAPGQPISYQIENPGAPIQYAPRPIANQLVSKPRTPIIPYTTGTVISPDDPSTDRAFTSIDLDQWMSSTLGKIDALLTPRYVAPAQILRDKTGTDAMQRVLDAKQALAGALARAMIAVFADETPSESQLVAIREMFYQRMLGALSTFYTVRAGLQFQAAVTSAIRPLPTDELPPQLYGEIVMNGGGAPIGAAGSLSLSSPKLTLDLAGGPASQTHDLSFLLSSAGLDARKVTLDLTFQGQAIEHEIGQLAGIEGYRPSSWLSFADASSDPSWPLTRPLGEFETPIVLRAFPETPVLLAQELAGAITCPCYQPAHAETARAVASDGCPRPGSYDPLDGLTRWSYRVRYAMQAHRTQDAVHGTITFNVTAMAQARRALADARDLFDNLAQFVDVYPAVLADLDRYLSPIDVGTQDETQIANAEAALLSAAAMVQWIADSVPIGVAIPAARMTLSAAPPVGFVLSQDGVVKTGASGDVVALRVTLALTAALPARVGTPFVEVEPKTFECEPDGSDGPDRWSFVYKDRVTGAYLTLERGLAIAARGVVVPDLELLERQDATASIYLARNEDLIPDRPIAPPFIYQTPVVELPAPLQPTIDHDEPVNIAAIDAVAPDQPVARSLACQLAVLYDALFAQAGTDTVTLALTMYYEYAMHTGLSKIRLPVYLQPPTLLALTGDGAGAMPIADLIARQVKATEDWFADHTPDQTGGTLLLDLSVMSNLTVQPMPLLRLRALYLDLAQVVPPLGP